MQIRNKNLTGHYSRSTNTSVFKDLNIVKHPYYLHEKYVVPVDKALAPLQYCFCM
jgi:hypothetical protein